MLIIFSDLKSSAKIQKLASLLQMSQDKIGHSGVKMVCGVSPTDPVILVGIDLHLELISGLNQGLGKIHGVLVMHVVITATMNEQEFSL
jgi:hypothetical protein